MNIIHSNRRNLVVALISFFGVLLSFLVLKPKNIMQEIQQQIILAKVIGMSNEVQKKSSGDIIWQILLPGDHLAQGDFVRTSRDSSAEIEFIQGQSKIRLGPETTIVVEGMQDERLGLNMIKGDLLIQTTNTKNSIALKTKEGEISLNDATAGVSLDKSGKLALEVFKGEVKAKNGQGENTVKENENAQITNTAIVKNENLFQILEPKIGETIYLDAKKSNLEIKWVEHKQQFQYQLFLGRSADLLAPVKIDEHNKTMLKAKIGAGNYYWKIVAKNKTDSYESSVGFNQVQIINAPQLLQPSADQTLYKKNNEFSIVFEWYTTFKKNQTLEIAQSKIFQEVLFSSPVEEINRIEINQIKQPGKYFWRVKTLIPQIGETTSEIFSFEIKEGDGLVPPILDYPKNDLVLNQDDVESGVRFSWRAVAGVQSYRLRIIQANGQFNDYNTNLNYSNEIKLNPGKYRWMVASLDDQNKQSEFSNESIFEIKKLPTIAWLESLDTIHYYQDQTQYLLKWKDMTPLEREYFISIIHAESQKQYNYQSTKSEFVWQPRQVGTFQIKIEARVKNDIIAKTGEREIKVIEFPLLPAPKLDTVAGQNHKADGFGNFNLTFKAVESAKYYQIEIKHPDGRLVRTEQSDQPLINIKTLFPGNYVITLRSVDAFNRPSPPSDLIYLEVPAKSDIKKPVLKKVNVR